MGVVLFLLLGVQDDPGTSFRLTAKLESATVEGEPAFVLSGSTDLPDGAVVMIDLFREGTPEGSQFHCRAVRVEKGAWRDVARVFSIKNPAGTYAARVRYDLKFQDRIDVGEAIVKLNRRTWARAEARLALGEKDDVEKEYRQICGRLAAEIDEMTAIADRARDAYWALRQGAEPSAWKKEMQALKDRAAEIERRNADRNEYRYFAVTDVSNAGLEHLRRGACALIDDAIRAAGSPEEFEHAAAVRFQALLQDARRFKGMLRVTDDAAAELARELGLSAARGDRDRFERLLAALAHVMPADRYSEIQEIAEAGIEFFDRVGRPEAREKAERLQTLIDAIAR